MNIHTDPSIITLKKPIGNFDNEALAYYWHVQATEHLGKGGYRGKICFQVRYKRAETFWDRLLRKPIVEELRTFTTSDAYFIKHVPKGTETRSDAPQAYSSFSLYVRETDVVSLKMILPNNLACTNAQCFVEWNGEVMHEVINVPAEDILSILLEKN
jgi:hypothetical protein